MSNPTVENAKKNLEKFTRSISSVDRVKAVRNNKSLSFDKESNEYNRKYFGMANFNIKDVEESNVADLGINEDSINNQVLYNSDLSNTKGIKKFRRIKQNKSNDINIHRSLFKQQANLNIKMHSDIMSLNNKFHTTNLKHMEELVTSVKHLSQIKNTVELDYYKQTLTNQTSLLEEVKGISQILKKGFNLNDRLQKEITPRQESMIRQLLSSGNIKGQSREILTKLAKEAMNDSTGGMGSMAFSSAISFYQIARSNGGLIRQLGSMGMNYGMDKLMTGIVGNGRSGNRIKNMISNPGEFFENLMNTWALTQGGAKGWLGKKLGNSKKMEGIDLSKYLRTGNKENAMFDQAAHTALTRVITKSLSNIESAFTGKPALFYNYSTNRFETAEEARREMKDNRSKEMASILKGIKSGINGHTKVKKKGGFLKKDISVDHYGVFGDILSLNEDIDNAKLKTLKDLIKTRGNEIADSIMKIIMKVSKYTDAGSVLDAGNLSLEFIMECIYPKSILNNPRADLNKLASGAMVIKVFLETLRDLESSKGQEIWMDLVRIANDGKEKLELFQEKSKIKSEGSVSQWYTYNLDRSSNKKVKYAWDNYFDYDISGLEANLIDLSGVLTEEEMTRRVRSEYNKMISPLFKGSFEHVKSNLRNQYNYLAKKNHFFAPYMKNTLNAFEQGGMAAFSNKDYAEAAGINTYEDLLNHKRKMRINKYDPVNSAKEIAKWHIQNDPKAKGLLNLATAGGYAGLIKIMSEKSGMMGPMGSTILGISAASTAILSGKMGKMVDIMTTGLGDEKMLDKDGNETNVTRRQALNEAMYREMLPKSAGMMAGMKFGGWIKNNIRFGPVIGPVIGLTSGFILSKASPMMVKVASLFGSLGKKMLNWFGQKLTGNPDALWGDNVKNIIKEKLGLPTEDHKFTVKDILNQTGKTNSKKDNVMSFITGQAVDDIVENKKQNNDFATKYHNIRNNYKQSVTSIINTNMETTYESLIDKYEEELYTDKKEEKNVATINILGGHLEAVGVVGMVDQEAYSNRVKSLIQQYSKSSDTGDPRSKKTAIIKEKFMKNMNLAQNFSRSSAAFREEAKEQDIQEIREQQNSEVLQRIANGEFQNKEDKKPKKKKGILDWLKLGAAGFLFLPQLLKGMDWAKKNFKPFKWIDSIYGKKEKGDLLHDGRISFAGDAFRVGRKVWTGKKMKTLRESFIGQGIKKLGKGIFNGTKKIGTKVLEKTGLDTKATALLAKVLDASGDLLKKIPGMSKIAPKIVDGFIPGIKKIFKELTEKISSKMLKEGAEKAAKKGILSTIKQGITAGGVTAWINIGFIAWDAWQGVKKAKEFFQISENDNPTAVQKWACALTFGILSMIESVPTIGYIAMIVSAIDSLMKWLCIKIYKILDSLLDKLGLGDNEDEAEEIKILEEGANKDDEGKLFQSKEGAYKSYNQKMEEKISRINKNEMSDEEFNNVMMMESQEMLEQYNQERYGGSGSESGYKGTQVKGKDVKSNENTPQFFNQNSFSNIKVGSLSTNDDGCSLAVMKMIAAFKGIELDDATLISKMSQYALSNRTVSISFFSEFGGRVTDNKEDLRNALNDPNCAIALLTKSNHTNHFIALIPRDNNSMYVGDPLKDNWEVISKKDNNIIAYAMAAAIFSSNSILTRIGTPARYKDNKGGGAGGFGTKAKANTFKGHITDAISKVSKGVRGVINMFVGNSSSEEVVEETQSTGSISTGAISSGPYTGGKDAILKTIAYGETGNENYSDPKVLGRADNDSGPGTYPRMPYDAYGIQGLNTAPGNSWWDFVKAGYLEQLGLPNHGKFIHNQEFRRQWQEAANKDPKKMLDTQSTFFFTKYLGLDPNDLEGSIASKSGMNKNVASDPGVMVYVADMMNQYGPAGGMKRAKAAASAKTPQEAMEMMRAVDNFREKPGVMNRVNKRRAYFQKYTKGGSGVNYPNEIKIYGQGIGYSADSLKTCFVKQSEVGKVLGLTGKQNTTCGIAVALMIQKIVYFSQHKRFDAHTVKAWADKNKLFSKDLGVSQDFFRRMGLEDIPMNEVRKSTKKVTVGTFANQDSHGNPKGWGLRPFEIDVLNAGGHWILLTRLGNIPYILDPMQDKVLNLFERKDLAGKEVSAALHTTDASKIINMLVGTPSHIKSLDSANSKDVKNSAGGMGANQVSNQVDANGNPIVPNTSTGDTTTGNTVQEEQATPNRGTSAMIGGWYYKDKDGEIKQVFFGSKVKKKKSGSGQNNNASTDGSGTIATGGSESAFPISDGIPGLPIIDPIPLKPGDRPYEAAKQCLAKAHDGSISECRIYTVNAMIRAGYPRAFQTTWRIGKQDIKAGRKLPGPGTDCRPYVGLPPDLGFTQISVASKPQPGDICIIWPFGSHESGHVQMYVGAELGAPNSGWVSDFKQKRRSPYGSGTPENGGKWYKHVTLYRDSAYCGKRSGQTPHSSGSTELKTQTKGVVPEKGDKDKKDKIEEKQKEIQQKVNNVPEPIYKEFKKYSDASRNASGSMRDYIARSKYEIYTKNNDTSATDYFNKKKGPFTLAIKDKNTAIAKSTSVLSGVLQDYGNNQDKPLVKALTSLVGLVADQTVQEQNGTKALLKAQKEYTATLEEYSEEVSGVESTTNAMAKKDNTIVTNQQLVTGKFLEQFKQQSALNEPKNIALFQGI